MTLTLSKCELGSLSGLPNTQNLISGVKTLCFEMFLILLERSQIVDVENGLA
jgi:hypothetical protein